MHKYLDMTEKETGLTLTVIPGMEADLAECADIFDALEYQMGNGWERVLPEEVGALTDALIITKEAERDDRGNLIKCGRVYADMNYQVADLLETLQTKGQAFMVRG